MTQQPFRLRLGKNNLEFALDVMTSITLEEITDASNGKSLNV